jgi:hypothetical protein
MTKNTKTAEKSIHILETEIPIRFDQALSIARKEGGEIAHLSDFIRELNPETGSSIKLYKKLKGREFWLGDYTPSKTAFPAHCKIDYENCTIKGTEDINTWFKLAPEQKILVFNGEGPFSLKICDELSPNQRFILYVSNTSLTVGSISSVAFLKEKRSILNLLRH